MGNMCCRREVYAPNGTETDPSRCAHHQQQHLSQQHQSKHPQPQLPAMSNAYHSAGDDCAINELLEGRMDLDVLMPDGRQVRLTVERRTPMMDLLVQAASATKISPGGHVIQVFEDGDKSNGTLQYKPSTPIGTLDTNTIYIVSKKEAGDPQNRRMGKTANRPFEPTFRVQVHLPRNQLTVLRVSPRVKIAELKTMVCKEKGLDTGRYQLVRTNGPAEPLSGDMTLAEYGSTEITLLSNSKSHICNSTSHIIPYSKRAEEQKRRNGILRLLAEDVHHKTTISSSACRIDGHQRNGTAKTEDSNVHQNRFKPKKRRPAPPPPPPILPEVPYHSRQSSSDSSGYHEATSSFLHEEHSGEEKASSDSSGVSSLDAKGPSIQPNISPVQHPKKKKAPAPPIPPATQKDKVTSEKVHLSNHSVNETVSNQAPVLQKEIIIQDKVISHKDPVDQENLSLKLDSNLKKDLYIQNDYINSSDSLLQNSTVLKNQIVQNGLTAQTYNVVEKCPLTPKDIDDAKHTPPKMALTHENLVLLNNDLNHKGNLSQENFIPKDYIPPKDHVVLSDHAILKDQVLKLDPNTEKKLDIPHVWESEGQRVQSQMTVAAKELPTAIVSTDPAEKEKVCDRVTEVKQKAEAGSLVPDTDDYRTSGKKSEKDKLFCKGEVVSTRVALVALNARIEQDVTQQEIASSIQAAFHSVDCSPQPSLLAIKPRNNGESNVHTIRYSETLSEPHEISPSQTESVTVSLNSESDEENFKESLLETSTKFKTVEKEALLIDEEPFPRPASTSALSAKNLKRSSSLLNFTDSVVPRNVSSKNTNRARHLQRSLSDLNADDKEDFEAEQERLQKEYIKLQRQFILWQQQLMNNHAMLREECIVPQYARTLRQSHSLPEGEDYSNDSTPSIPLVSRSLSYEPTKERYSTLPRSTINIPSLEFGSITVNTGTSTLRSSKTKSYFKPPQVRVSTKSRQRLPPEIKKEGDVDITDDTKMLTTILPSFESLKLISENTEEDIPFCVSRFKNSNSTAKAPPLVSQGSKISPLVHHSTFSKQTLQINNGDRIADKNQKCVNGDTGQSKLPVNCSKIVEQSLNSQLPPPPPPLPVSVGGVSKAPAKENCIKSSGKRNGVGRKDFTPTVDPREKLMLEIRKFGGRTALRKISLAS